MLACIRTTEGFIETHDAASTPRSLRSIGRGWTWAFGESNKFSHDSVVAASLIIPENHWARHTEPTSRLLSKLSWRSLTHQDVQTLFLNVVGSAAWESGKGQGANNNQKVWPLTEAGNRSYFPKNNLFWNNSKVKRKLVTIRQNCISILWILSNWPFLMHYLFLFFHQSLSLSLSLPLFLSAVSFYSWLPFRHMWFVFGTLLSLTAWKSSLGFLLSSCVWWSL